MLRRHRWGVYCRPPTLARTGGGCDDGAMGGRRHRQVQRKAGTLLAIFGALFGLVFLGAGGAVLTGTLLVLLDGDVLWPQLIAGTIGCAAGVVVFLRASWPWVHGATARATRAGGVARVLAAGVAIVLGVGTSTVMAVSIGGVIADRVFQDACSGLEGLGCLIQGQVGGATAGLLLGIRGAQSALRARWTILVLLLAVAGLEGVLLLAQQPSN